MGLPRLKPGGGPVGEAALGGGEAQGGGHGPQDRHGHCQVNLPSIILESYFLHYSFSKFLLL
jgi:hypothetical protein